MSIVPRARADGWLRVLSTSAFAMSLICLSLGSWIPLKAWAAQWLIDAAWRRERAGSNGSSPWPWADTHPIAKLTWGEGASAPTLIVLEGSSGRNLAFGPVHDTASVLPGGRGNSVIEGHRDTHFTILRTAKPGDHLSIEALDGRRSAFVVTDVRIVDSRTTRIALDAGAPRLTLSTCYPFDAVNPGGPFRWVVTATSVTPAGAPRLQSRPPDSP